MRTQLCIFLILSLAACKEQASKTKMQVNSNTDTLISNMINPKIEFTLETPNDTTKNFYVTVFPEGEIREPLILLSGFSELPKETLASTDIYKICFAIGLHHFYSRLRRQAFLLPGQDIK